MATIQLDQEQTDALRQTLESALSSLRFEISHTDHANFRDMLKRRRMLLDQLLSKITAAGQAAIAT